MQEVTSWPLLEYLSVDDLDLTDQVNKGQTDYVIRSATYDFLLTFHSN